MGKKKYSGESSETDPETRDVLHKKRKYTETSEIIHFVKQKKMKNPENEQISVDESKDNLPIDSSNKKKLRFDIDGEVIESEKGSTVKDDKSVTKKVRKPRWSQERKVEEKKKACERPIEKEELKQKTKKNKRKKKKIALNQENSSASSTSAIQYLQTWQYDRSSWKFSKFKQTWLLKNMFDLKKVPTSVFPVLVEYISGSQGGARLKTYEAASKIIQNLEEKVGSEEITEEEEIARCLTEDSEEDKEEIHQRARSIMQALSDCT